MPRLRAEATTAQQQVEDKEKTLKTAEEKQVSVELAVQRIAQRLAELTAKRIESQNRAELLGWVRNTQPNYARLVAQHQEQTAELQRATEMLGHLRAVEIKTAGDRRAKEAAVVQTVEKLRSQRAELAALQALQVLIPAWQTNRTRLTAVRESEQAQVKALESLRAAERELAPQFSAANAEENRLARQIAEVDKNQSELRTLVSKLQGHVNTGTCPLCGEEHGSKEELLQRIQKHVVTDAATGARADLTGVRARARALGESVAANKQKQQALDAQAVVLKNERSRIETEIAQFVTTATKLAVAVEAAGPTPSEQVQARTARLQQEVADLDTLHQKAGTEVELARVAETDAKKLATAKQVEIDDRKAALVRIGQESNRLRADPRATQISLDIEPAQLGEVERLNLQHHESFKAEAGKLEEEANKKRTELAAFRQEVAALKGQLVNVRLQLGNLQKTIAQALIKLEEAKLPTDTTDKSLLAMIADQGRLQAQMLTLRDNASSLELAIDAATTAAALTTLRQTIRNREKTARQAALKRDLHLPWLKYFGEVSRLVATEQNEAIANFTHEYLRLPRPSCRPART